MSQAKNSVKIIGWVVAGVLLAGGYYFLKDRRLLSHEKYYNAYFTDVQGLAPSSQVNINGVRVGKIADVELSGRLVKIVLSVHDDIQLPAGTTAKLSSGGISGDKMIDLDLGPGPAMLPEYATLVTKIDTSLLPVSVRFTPMFETMKYMLRSTDTALGETSQIISTQLISKTAINVIKMEEKTRGLAHASATLNANTDKIAAGINNAATKTGKMVESRDSLNRSIDNLNNKTASLANAGIGQKIDSIQQRFSKLGASFRELNASVKGFGKLLNDTHTYQQYSSSFDTMSQNMSEYHKNPPGFSIFGKKKKKK